MIVRDDLDGLFNELMTLILQTLAVPMFSRVDTTTEVVVLGRRGRRSEQPVSELAPHMGKVREKLTYRHRPVQHR